jgi:hypothetical protein
MASPCVLIRLAYCGPARPRLVATLHGRCDALQFMVAPDLTPGRRLDPDQHAGTPHDCTESM